MKRILAVAFAVVVLCVPLLAMSASAVTESSNGYIIPFDEFTMSDYAGNSSVWYPLSLGRVVNGYYFSNTYEDTSTFISVENNGVQINGNRISDRVSFYDDRHGNGYRVKFRNRDFVIPTARLSAGTMNIALPASGVDWGIEVNITANLAVMVNNGDEWVDRNIPIARTAEYLPGQSVPIASLLWGIVPQQYRNLSYLRFTNLVVEVATEADSDILDVSFVSTSGVTPGYGTVQDWLNQYDLATETYIVEGATPEGTDFTQWLAVAVGSFLNIELWPGFSLNMLMYAVLGFVVFFAIVKVLK